LTDFFRECLEISSFDENLLGGWSTFWGEFIVSAKEFGFMWKKRFEGFVGKGRRRILKGFGEGHR
jgi:hypothetical protein